MRRISPQEFAAQGEEFTREQIRQLVHSRDYQELQQQKGADRANWNWQEDPNQSEASSEGEELPEAVHKADISPVPKKRGPEEREPSPPTASSAKKTQPF